MRRTKNITLPFISLSVVVLALVSFALSLITNRVYAQTFTLPSPTEKILWEAEKAKRRGNWVAVKHPWASNGAYVKPQGENIGSNTTLEFPFLTDRFTTIRVWPKWWIHGERKSAKRYPTPIATSPGPDVIDYYNKFVFFTCPETGRIGVLDAATESLLGSIELGTHAYPEDLLVDRSAAKVYVADALGGRVIVFDANYHPSKPVKISEIKVPAGPCSLTLSAGKLYVACREGKSLTIVDTDRRKVLKRIALAEPPLFVAVQGGSVPRVVVWPMARTFDLATLKERKPHKLRYPFSRRTSVVYKLVVEKRIDHVKPYTLRIRRREPTGWRESSLDVQAVTGSARIAKKFTYPLRDNPGPDVMDIYGNLLFFTSPSTGKVGVVDMTKDALLKGIDVGGYLTDLIVDRVHGKIYVADAVSNRIVILHPASQTVSGKIKVPKQPWSLIIDGNRLFVACRAGRCVVVIDTARDTIVQKINLPTEPLQLQTQLKPSTGWWPLMTAEEMVESQYPRLLVRMTPIAFNPTKLTTVRTAGIADAPPGKRRKITCRLAKVFQVFVPQGSEWKYQISFPSSEPPADAAGRKWFEPSYNASGWTRGKSPLGYGDENRAQYGTHLRHKLGYGFFRKKFTFKGPIPLGAAVALNVASDDSARIYLNGKVVDQDPIFGKYPGHEFSYWSRQIAIDPTLLKEGENTLAAYVFNVPRSSDLYFDLELVSMPASLIGKSVMKTFTVDDTHTIGVNGNRWVDVSSITDAQLLPNSRPLAIGDKPGTIVVSMDSGAEYDWRRNICTTPDQKLFLINDTDEFWRWNAPTFSVGPGKHLLKVRACSPHAQIDGITVSRCLQGYITAKIDTRPPGVKSNQKTYPGQYSVFYYNEPILVSVEIANLRGVPQKLTLSYRLDNYMDEEVTSGKRELTLKPAPTQTEWFEFKPKDQGIFHFIVTIDSVNGRLIREHRFLVMPKLEHPRLLFRKEEIPEIKARIKKYPRLFERYASWLRRQCGTIVNTVPSKLKKIPELKDKDFDNYKRISDSVRAAYNSLGRNQDALEKLAKMFNVPKDRAKNVDICARCIAQPEGAFLPKGLSGKTISPMEQYRDLHRLNPNRDTPWREYDLAWRMLACQFASMFLEKSGDDFFKEQLKPLLAENYTDGYCQYHHHGPFFPGAVAALFDMSAMDSDECKQKIRKMFTPRMADMNVFPWGLISYEEPLTSGKRALLSEIMKWAINWERYFSTHCGKRGGTWWLNPRTGCNCPTSGYMYSALYLRSFFNEKRLLDKKLFRGFFSFIDYVHPRYDNKRLLGPRGPHGEPARWITTALSKHPLERRLYGWEEWVRRLNSATPIDDKTLDEFFKSKVSITVPVALALGWYNIEGPTVDWKELPPTILFDVEGQIPMRSSWGKDLTEVCFVSGARDHTYRHQQNHIRIAKAGEFLLGTASLYGDHGNPVPSWGNVVVAGSDWARRWYENLWHCRAEEYFIFYRFSPATWQYIKRDVRLTRYAPAEVGWGGGVDLHGHTQSSFLQEGKIVAYETWPEFDYAAGDATNAWLIEEISEIYRQVVFIKPDVVVIYDRGKLGPKGNDPRWLAATGPTLTTEGNSFSITNGSAILHGKVLLPQRPAFTTYESLKYKNLFTRWQSVNQKVIEIRPSASRKPKAIEYLVVMNVGTGKVAPLTPQLIHRGDLIGAEFTYKNMKVKLLFRRDGVVGGHISIIGGRRPINHDLVQKVDDHYNHWRDDPRFKSWMSEARFHFLSLE